MSLRGNLARWWLHQNWIGLRYKKSAYRYLTNHDESHDISFTRDFFGLRYEGNLQNGIEFAIFYYGAFEKPLLFFFRDFAQRLQSSSGKSQSFWDVGSNVGQHALFMSQYVSQVHAFEPYAPVRARLEHHIALNQLDNITVHGVGLGESNGELNFYAPTGRNQGIGSFASDNPNHEEPPTRDIGQLKVVSGDSYRLEQKIAPPDLLKIDVEGFERMALSGMAQLLAEHRPPVVCEISYEREKSFTSLQDLQRAFPENYLFYQFDTRKPDGSTDRRRTSRAKRSGAYKLIPMNQWRDGGQDDIVAVPAELESLLPLQNP